MKKISVILTIVLLTLIAAVVAVLFYINSLKNSPSSDGQMSETTLDQKDIVAITKPAVVRIVVHAIGEATLPNFKIDYSKMDIIPDPNGPREEISFNEYLSGSGFFVNSKGYIMTNSHVVSYQSVKAGIAAPYAADILLKDILQKVQSGNSSDLNPNATSEQGEQLAKKALDYLLAEGKFDIDKKIIVLDPSSSKEKIQDLFADGISASVVSVNDAFLNNDQDIALLKISGENFPSLNIGDPGSLSIGSTVTVFGFPASADFNEKNNLESTLTTGSISALKDSQKKDFKIFQTDAKISQGSSGGPVLTDKGEVVGVITYQTSEIQRITGDNFAFALPIDKATGWASQYAVGSELEPDIFSDGAYADHFKRGLEFLESKRGKKALDEFSLAIAGNSKFSTAQYINSYIQEAYQLISSGRSIDTKWDEKKTRFGNFFGSSTLVIAGLGIVILAILIVLIFFLAKPLKKDENEIRDFKRDWQQASTDLPANVRTNAAEPIEPASAIIQINHDGDHKGIRPSKETQSMDQTEGSQGDSGNLAS